MFYCTLLHMCTYILMAPKVFFILIWICYNSGLPTCYVNVSNEEVMACSEDSRQKGCCFSLYGPVASTVHLLSGSGYQVTQARGLHHGNHCSDTTKQSFKRVGSICDVSWAETILDRITMSQHCNNVHCTCVDLINCYTETDTITIVQSYTGKYHEFVAVCIVTSAQHE